MDAYDSERLLQGVGAYPIFKFTINEARRGYLIDGIAKVFDWSLTVDIEKGIAHMVLGLFFDCAMHDRDTTIGSMGITSTWP